MDVIYKIKSVVLFYLFFVSLFCGNVVLAAACTPGIPCTNYDINTDTTAGTNATLNGPKSGTPSPYNTGSCDGNFMNQIYARAFMEASREVIMSEQLIHKPDSVLEYTCFDKYIAKAAHQAGPIFTENTRWQNFQVNLKTGDDTSTTTTINTGSTTWPAANDQTDYSVFESDRVDNRLSALLFDSLNNYLTNNFAHTYMGGTISINSSVGTSIGADDYACSEMKTVWDIAKCADFGEDDKFRSFENLMNNDPRAMPAACSTGLVAVDSDQKIDTYGVTTMTLDFSSTCPASVAPPAALRTGLRNDLLRVADNCEYKYSDFDVINTKYDLIKAPTTNAVLLSAGHPALCSAPIPTGIMVESYVNTDTTVSGVDTKVKTRFVHYEHICVNPGCYYRTTKVVAPGSSTPSVPTGICAPM